MAQDDNRIDRTNDFLAGMFVLGFIVGGIALIVWLLQDQLVFVWRVVRFYQYSITEYIPLIGPSASELPMVLDWLQNTPSREIYAETMWEFDQHYGQNFGIFLAAIFIWVGVKRLKSNAGATGPELSAESVFDALIPIFPHLQYIKDHNPVGRPLKYVPGGDNQFAMPVQVFEFAEMQPPMHLEKKLTPEQAEAARPIYLKDEKDFFNAFDKNMAANAFEAQMGPPLTTLKEFSASEKKAYYFFKKRLDAKLPKGRSTDIIRRLEQKHGYVRTFLMGLFEEVKRLGITTTNDDLMPIMDSDRTLFWCLDSVGRDTPWIEAAGPYVHKDMEDLVGIRITEPEVTEAVASLRRYLELDRATQHEIAESMGENGMDEGVA
ncbi:secretion/conjugation apparatus DotM-related subunit [Marinobacter shengliensis]|uniref:secretion/conjugation apparatus DotM-related subunit n=1 Tax=Marinobacter shengliensis TaxID=1389223 RepID=UPI0011084B5E|nr:hypothetical protein [Marinobacter shengliensis]